MDFVISFHHQLWSQLRDKEKRRNNKHTIEKYEANRRREKSKSIDFCFGQLFALRSKCLQTTTNNALAKVKRRSTCLAAKCDPVAAWLQELCVCVFVRGCCLVACLVLFFSLVWESQSGGKSVHMREKEKEREIRRRKWSTQTAAAAARTH